MSHTYAVILAGGRGERFWPLSTFHRPKQFVTLFGGKPLLTQAVDRLTGVTEASHVFVITSADLVETSQSVLPQVPKQNIIGEVMGRDTAAAVALACGLVRAQDPEGVVAILTADQLMGNVDAFRQVLKDSFAVAAREDAILTIGIAPTFPATGFGYIECGDALAAAEVTPFREGVRFVEKPDLDHAKQYLETGRFVWNAGMFIWRVSVMEQAFRTLAPDWVPLIEQPESAAELYPTLPKLSIDYAVMEKAPRLLVAAGDFGWDDVGSFTALDAHFPADAQGNITLGAQTAVASTGCTVIDDGTQRHTALLGVKDVIVVHTPTVTLVCDKAHAQQMKSLVQQLPDQLK